MTRGRIVSFVLGLALAVGGIYAARTAESAAAPAEETGQWTLEKVLALSRDEVIELWKAAPAPVFTELDGHYMGLVPNAGDEARRAATDAAMFNENSDLGYWLGKAYKPTTATTGEGYNRWRFPGGKIVRNLRFGTEMGTSLIDGKPALLMYYGAFNEGNTLVDEIRKLDDYVYLGTGTREAAGGGRTEPGHFVLIGPTDEWVGVGQPEPTEP